MPVFYGFYTAAVATGVALVLSSHSLIRLAVDVELLNALLLPLVLGFLVLLAFRVLPWQHAPGRKHRLALSLVAGALILVGLFSAGLALGL